MKSKLKILMVFSEVAPFAKTGGLADVGESLPKMLKEMDHDVRIITPQYMVTNERKYILRDVIRLQNIEVPLGQKTIRIHVKSAFLPNSKVQVYFINHKSLFFREGLYVDPKSNRDYLDNDKRFALFNRGVLETLNKLQWQPDIVHCNDWQTGLIPFYLKTTFKNDPFFNHTYTVFTIHNIAYQGNFSIESVKELGIDHEHCGPGGPLEFHGKCSFLKAGIVYADTVNTVSENYAKELQSSSHVSYGFEDVVRSRKKELYGILNGIDDNVWNPEVDSSIPVNYSISSLDGKGQNKQALFDKISLPSQPDIPVVSMITRLVDQKGIDLIHDAFDEIMQLKIFFILLGIGDEGYQRFFIQAQKKYKDKVRIQLSFDEPLSHLIMAGSDIFLMPSKTEPCGLTQLYGLKYGTIPLVFRTGGLADTIRSYDLDPEKGNGFVFDKYNVKQFIKTLKRAVRLYNDKKTWMRIIKNGMKEDFSWRVSAKKYIQLYNKCICKKK